MGKLRINDLSIAQKDPEAQTHILATGPSSGPEPAKGLKGARLAELRPNKRGRGQNDLFPRPRKESKVEFAFIQKRRDEAT